MVKFQWKLIFAEILKKKKTIKFAYPYSHFSEGFTKYYQPKQVRSEVL